MDGSTYQDFSLGTEEILGCSGFIAGLYVKKEVTKPDQTFLQITGGAWLITLIVRKHRVYSTNYSARDRCYMIRCRQPSSPSEDD